MRVVALLVIVIRFPKLNWDHQDVHITLRRSCVTRTHCVNRIYYGEIVMLASHMVLVLIVAGEHISQGSLHRR